MEQKTGCVAQGLLILVLAVILGVGSAAAAIYLRAQGPLAKITNGPWETSLQIGSTRADMYTRATVALFGTLALDPSEVIYYIAFEDSDGETLSYKCNYRIQGADYDARWWSLTVYNNFYFIPTETGRYSFSSTTTKKEPDGKWTVRLSANPQEGNWLDLGNKDGRINLNFRLYNPGPAVMNNLEGVDLPRIIREGCR